LRDGTLPDSAPEKKLDNENPASGRSGFRISFYKLSLSFQKALKLPAPLQLGVGSSRILGKTPGFHRPYRVCSVAGVHYHSPFQETTPSLSEEQMAPRSAFFVPVTRLSAGPPGYKPFFIYML
jgi:hypothetical protein